MIGRRVRGAWLMGLMVLAAGLPATASGATPANDWIGILAPASAGSRATCSLGGAVGVDVSSSVWVAVAGGNFLDIVQVGAQVTPDGRRFFAAYGRGTPHGPDSLYVEEDLGPADARSHAYEVSLVDAEWTFSIDGAVRLTVPDTFRTWQARWTEVATETSGRDDLLGGTKLRPVACSGARALHGTWQTESWAFFGYGAKAAAARSRFGSDRFAIWR